MSRVAGAVAGLLAAAAAGAAAQSPVSVTLSGRMHYQWNTTSIDTAGDGVRPPSNTFETRRLRLAVNVRISDWITGQLEPEFTLGRLAVRQAWIAFALDSGTVLRAGQMKKPFGAILLNSSSQFPAIERGVRIRGLDEALAGVGATRVLRGEALTGEHFALLDVQRYASYEMGLQLEQQLGPVAATVGVYNGTGPDQRDENDSKSVAARLAWRSDGALPVGVGAAVSRRELSWPNAAATDTRAGNAFAIDVELGGFRRGVWLIAEAALGDNLITEERFRGVQAVAALFHALGGPRVEGVEPLVRVSWGDPDDAQTDDAGVLLTPGINLYFFGRNRLMLNWDVYLPEGSLGTQHAARAQVNLHF